MIEEKTEVPNGRTLAQLIEEYKTDSVSGFKRMRYGTRMNHENVLRRMSEKYGHLQISEIRNRTLEEMYQHWGKEGQTISMAHTFMAKLRAVCGYGAGMLDDMDCNRICMNLSRRRYPMQAKAKESFLTAEMATAIREKARQIGYFSIALAQAFQFDCVLRQGDCIGYWVPVTEPGESDVIWGDMKWVRGIRWEEIDENLVLRHVTSKRGKKLTVPLADAPMVKEELDLTPSWVKTGHGPVIVYEATGKPWKSTPFRQKWRIIADICGIPKDIKNMDSRSGGISEGTNAGVSLELMRHAATHSDISTTQRLGYLML